MQNLPSSGTKYAKLIKSCIKPPKGWLLVGADFNALEARISALTTSDPNKLKIYLDGYDSHCVAAAAYFPEKMPDIQELGSDTQCFKITSADGSVTYLKQGDLVTTANGEVKPVESLQ